MEEKLFFDNDNGIELCGILNKPSEPTDKVVILAHGYGSHKDRPKYLKFADGLGKNNIATFRFDFLGRGESKGKIEDTTISEGADEILKAMELMKSEGFSEFGLIGVSFGGIASAIAASKTDELKVLVLVCPVSDYVSKKVLEMSDEGISKWKETGYALVEDKPLKYGFFKDAKRNIVYDVAGKITAPTMIIHGTKDDSVPYEQSEKTSKLIRNCILRPIQGANHRFTEPEHNEEMTRLAVEFISGNI